jgi:hypothetical protein
MLGRCRHCDHIFREFAQLLLHALYARAVGSIFAEPHPSKTHTIPSIEMRICFSHAQRSCSHPHHLNDISARRWISKDRRWDAPAGERGVCVREFFFPCLEKSGPGTRRLACRNSHGLISSTPPEQMRERVWKIPYPHSLARASLFHPPFESSTPPWCVEGGGSPG